MYHPRVVVYGGYGFFGWFVVGDILTHTHAHVVVTGRHPPREWGFDDRVTLAVSDLNDLPAVEATLADADVVVHCAGPYQNLPLNLLRGAITCQVHYVDLAEDREFVRRVHEFDGEAQQAGIAVMRGLSVVPGMATLLTQAVRSSFDE